MDSLKWMAWTWPTAVFFIFIATCLITMFVWELWRPGGNPRVGVLGLDTTRGDRLFISLLGSAYIHVAWLGLTDLPNEKNLSGNVHCRCIHFRSRPSSRRHGRCQKVG